MRYKYRNVKCRFRDRIYDSRREAGEAMWLAGLLKQGKIREVKAQHKIPIYVNDKFICNHYVDFYVVLNDGRQKFMEVKGFATEVWRIKKALVEAINCTPYLVNPSEQELLK